MSMVMLSDEDLVEIVEKRLPSLIRRRPDLRGRLHAAWSDMLAAIPEIAAIMEGFRQMHLAQAALQQETQQQFETLANGQTELRQEMQQNFKQVDQRFEQVDQRFEQVDQRFDQVDQRFDQVDQHLEQVDQRFDQVDQRLDQVDQRFDQVDQRFGEVDQRLDNLSNAQDEFRQETRERFGDVLNTIDGIKDWVNLTSGRAQVRAGRALEDIVAGALRVALKNPHIRADQIKLRQKIRDVEGIIFPRGRQKEIDLLASNGELLAFEVKSVAEPEDIDNFADKVQLLRHLYPDKLIKGVFVTLAPEADVQQRCRELNIELAT